jgi:methyl coenzyme M reductase alpha subunit
MDHPGRPRRPLHKELNMDHKLHLLETFNARDAQGKCYKIKGYEHLMREHLFVASAEELWEPTGQAEYRLDSGEPLEMQEDGTLRLCGSDVVLTRQ